MNFSYLAMVFFFGLMLVYIILCKEVLSIIFRKKIWHFFFFRVVEEKLILNLKFFLPEMLYVLRLAEKLKERLTRIFAEKLLGETPCKLNQIFPPKNLVYFLADFFKNFFIYLSEIKKIDRQLIDSNTCIVYWLIYFVIYLFYSVMCIEEIKRQVKHELLSP